MLQVYGSSSQLSSYRFNVTAVDSSILLDAVEQNALVSIYNL
jgi:hypothetical protein